MAFGIIGYGAYVPRHRLDRAAIAAALGTPAGRGTRAVAGYDEDSTSMAVEAGRAALAASPGARPGRVWFATAAPAYLDKTNAAAVHAALGLDADAFAVDVAGLRGGMAALRAAADGGAPAIALLSDVRGGVPALLLVGSSGQPAAAFVLDHDRPEAPVIAEVVASASATTEVLDRWRLPGDAASRTWEERFGEQAYVPLAEQVVTDLVKAAGIALDELDHVVVTGAHTRAVRVVAGRLGAALPGALGDDLAGVVGNPGAAAPTPSCCARPMPSPVRPPAPGRASATSSPRARRPWPTRRS
jgi:hydroxymethylglutaryl-CoA synthase